MKKKIDTADYLDVDKLSTLLNGVSNKTPSVLKKTFNFKGRKSPEILGKIIDGITEDNQVVLDPFLGSGSTMIAALKSGRKFLGMELDNYTYNVLSVLFTKIDREVVDKYFSIIKQAVYTDVQNLYSTNFNGQNVYVKKILFDPGFGKKGYLNPTENREIKDGKNLIFVNPVNNIKGKAFDEDDWEKLQLIRDMDISGFPNDRYIENSRINITASTESDNYGRIFSHRAKVALMTIQNKLSELPKSKEKRFLQFALVSALTLTRIAQYGSSSDILYQVMKERAQEMNAWEQFETKFKAFKNFQDEYSDLLVSDFETTNLFDVIEGPYQKILQDYSKQILQDHSKKIDAIVTDFPYTDQVPYLERHQIYRVWLQHFSDDGVDYTLTDDMLSNEVVVTNAPSRPNKDLNHYYQDLDEMLGTFSKVIKEYGQVVFVLNLGKQKYFSVFAKIINYARKHGFEYISRIDIEHDDRSMRKQSAYQNTLAKDAVATFVKLPTDKQYFYLGDENFEKYIVDMTYKKILESTELAVPLNDLVVSFMREIERKGYVSVGREKKIQQVIDDNFHIVRGTHLVELDNDELYLDQATARPNELFNRLIDLVPRYVKSLLAKSKRFTLEDLYLALLDNLIDGAGRSFEELVEDSKNLAAIESVLHDYTSKVDGYYVARQLPNGVSEAVKDLNMMDPYDFESLIADLFTKLGYKNVIRQGGAGDLGVDVIGDYVNNDGEKERWLIQVKRWVNNVGSEPLQRLVAERQRLGTQRAIVVTTSDFTQDAKLISQQQDVLMMNGTQLITELERFWPGKYIKLLESKK